MPQMPNAPAFEAMALAEHRPSRATSVLRRVFPTEFQPPRDVPRRLLVTTGYFRLRTWMAAHGDPVPDARLYQPLYSPWAGEQAFERVYRKVQPYTLVSRDRCYMLQQTLLQASNLDGEVVECGVFRGGTALLAAETLQASGAEREVHVFHT